FRISFSLVRFVGMLTAFAMTGCGALSASSSSFAPLPAETLAETAWRQQSSSPAVYQGAGPLAAWHMTALERCGGELPPAALTRQLFVGAEELHRGAQSSLPVDRGELFRTISEARLDGVPLTLASYAIRDDGCWFSVVFWAPQ